MKWAEAIKSEMEAMNTHKVFKILQGQTIPPVGHTWILLMMIFDVKPDEQRKARLVAGGHATKEIPHEDVYFSVIHAENLWLLFLVTAINGHKLVVGDVSNAYLNA